MKESIDMSGAKGVFFKSSRKVEYMKWCMVKRSDSRRNDGGPGFSAVSAALT